MERVKTAHSKKKKGKRLSDEGGGVLNGTSEMPKKKKKKRDKDVSRDSVETSLMSLGASQITSGKRKDMEKVGRRMAHNGSTLESYTNESRNTVNRLKEKQEKMKKHKLMKKKSGETSKQVNSSPAVSVDSSSKSPSKRKKNALKFIGDGKALDPKLDRLPKSNLVQMTVTRMLNTEAEEENNKLAKKKSSKKKKKQQKLQPLAFVGEGKKGKISDGDNFQNAAGAMLTFSDKDRVKESKKSKKKRTEDLIDSVEMPAKKKKRKKKRRSDGDKTQEEPVEDLRVEKMKKKKKKKNLDVEITTTNDAEVERSQVEDEVKKTKKKKKKKKSKNKELGGGDDVSKMPPSLLSQPESEQCLERPQDALLGFVFNTDSEVSQVVEEEVVKVKKKKKKKKRKREMEDAAESSLNDVSLGSLDQTRLTPEMFESDLQSGGDEADVSTSVSQPCQIKQSKKKKKKDKSCKKDKSGPDHSDPDQDVEPDLDETTDAVAFGSDAVAIGDDVVESVVEAPRIIGTICMLPEDSRESPKKKKKRKKSVEFAEQSPSSHDFVENYGNKDKKKKSKKRKRFDSTESGFAESPVAVPNNDRAMSVNSDNLITPKIEKASPPPRKKRKSGDVDSDLRGLTQECEETRDSGKSPVTTERSLAHQKDSSRRTVLIEENGELTRVVTPKKVRPSLRKTSISDNSMENDNVGLSPKAPSRSPKSKKLKTQNCRIIISPCLFGQASPPKRKRHSTESSKNDKTVQPSCQKASMSDSSSEDDDAVTTPSAKKSTKSPTAGSSAVGTPGEACSSPKSKEPRTQKSPIVITPRPFEASPKRNRDSTESSTYGTPPEELRNGCKSSPKRKRSRHVTFEEGQRIHSPGSDSSEYSTPPEDRPSASSSNNLEISPEDKPPGINLQNAQEPAASHTEVNGEAENGDVSIREYSSESEDDLIPPSMPTHDTSLRRRSLDPIVTGSRNSANDSKINGNDSKINGNDSKIKKSDLERIIKGEWNLPEPVNNPTKLTKKQLDMLDEIHAKETQHLSGLDWQRKYTSKGLVLNVKNFEACEDRQLMYNFTKYFKDHPEAKTWQNNMFDQQNVRLKKFLMDTRFDVKMSHGILRSKKAALRRLRYIIRSAKKEQLTGEQKKKIAKLRERGFSWDVIADMVGSTRDKTRLCYEADTESKTSENYRKGTWTSEEIDDLTEAVIQVTNTNYQTVRGQVTGIDWAAVSRIVGSRSAKQCRRRWVDVMGGIPEGVKVTPGQQKEFLELLVEMYGNSSNRCNFEEVAKRLSWETTGANLQRRFGHWKRRVPDYESKTNAEIVQQIKDLVLPYIESQIERQGGQQQNHIFGS